MMKDEDLARMITTSIVNDRADYTYSDAAQPGQALKQVRALELWRRFFAERRGFLEESHQGDLFCFFCGEWQVTTDADEHDDNCIYIAARTLIEGKQGEA